MVTERSTINFALLREREGVQPGPLAFSHEILDHIFVIALFPKRDSSRGVAHTVSSGVAAPRSVYWLSNDYRLCSTQSHRTAQRGKLNSAGEDVSQHQRNASTSARASPPTASK